MQIESIVRIIIDFGELQIKTHCIGVRVVDVVHFEFEPERGTTGQTEQEYDGDDFVAGLPMDLGADGREITHDHADGARRNDQVD